MCRGPGGTLHFPQLVECRHRFVCVPVRKAVEDCGEDALLGEGTGGSAPWRADESRNRWEAGAELRHGFHLVIDGEAQVGNEHGGWNALAMPEIDDQGVLQPGEGDVDRLGIADGTDEHADGRRGNLTGRIARFTYQRYLSSCRVNRPRPTSYARVQDRYAKEQATSISCTCSVYVAYLQWGDREETGGNDQRGYTMSPTLLEREVVVAHEDERAQLSQIQALLERPTEHTAMLDDIALPGSILRVLRQIVPMLAAGELVTLVPLHTELTTREAAELLNVSRQYLVTLLDQGKMDYHMVGSHRRIYVRDLMGYKRRRDEDRQHHRDRLIRLSERLGLYDEE